MTPLSEEMAKLIPFKYIPLDPYIRRSIYDSTLFHVRTQLLMQLEPVTEETKFEFIFERRK